MGKIKILDKVALLVDKPDHQLGRGCVGIIIEIGWNTQKESPNYTVEFVDENTGEFFAEVFITDPLEIVPLYFNPKSTED
jgi:hypothetical protein